MIGFVDIPRDLSQVKAKVFLNLTKRQVICFGTGAAAGIPLYFLLRGVIGSSGAAMLMLIVMLPFFLLGIYEKNGRPLEKIVGDVVRARFLRPARRPYQTQNYYALLRKEQELDEEVERIIEKHQGTFYAKKGGKALPGPRKAPGPGRKAGNPGGHKPGKRKGQQTAVRPGQHTL